jgi:FixJ family two-component response regulator
LSRISEPAALVIAKDEAVRDSLRMLLEAHGLDTNAYAEAAAGLREHGAARRRRLLIIYQATAARGLEIVGQFRQAGLSFPAIVLAAMVDPTSDIEAWRSGVILLEAPPSEGALFRAIQAAL